MTENYRRPRTVVQIRYNDYRRPLLYGTIYYLLKKDLGVTVKKYSEAKVTDILASQKLHINSALTTVHNWWSL